MKNTIAERIFDFLKNFPPFDLLGKDQLLKISPQVKVSIRLPHDALKVAFNR